MPYVGKKPADIIATAVDTTTGTFSGVVDADAGITVDNITIDGTEIDLSSGDLTVDVAGDIILDADGGDIKLKDGGTAFANFSIDNAGLTIVTTASNADFKVNGVDGGSNITALTLDMSDAGAATLNNGLTLTDGNLVVANGHGIDFSAASGSASGSSSALLDDYEEGTFTPIYIGSTANPTITYDALQLARYTKIGRIVVCHIRLRTDAVSGGSGNLKLSGLPFTVSNTGDLLQIGNIVSNDFGSNQPHSFMAITNSTTSYLIYGNYNVNVVSDLQTGNNKNQIQGTLIYETT